MMDMTPVDSESTAAQIPPTAGRDHDAGFEAGANDDHATSSSTVRSTALYEPWRWSGRGWIGPRRGRRRSTLCASHQVVGRRRTGTADRGRRPGWTDKRAGRRQHAIEDLLSPPLTVGAGEAVEAEPSAAVVDADVGQALCTMSGERGGRRRGLGGRGWSAGRCRRGRRSPNSRRGRRRRVGKAPALPPPPGIAVRVDRRGAVAASG